MENFRSGQPSAMRFILEITKIIAALEPLAKAIKCLEASETTPADVYAFFVATMSSYSDLFSTNKHCISAGAMTDMRAILNRRFNELINEAPDDVYLTCFFLHPSKYHFMSTTTDLTNARILRLSTRYGSRATEPITRDICSPITHRWKGYTGPESDL